MDFAGVLDLVRQRLDADRAPWALIGGLALAVHGAGRLTRDLDLATERWEQASLIAYLESIGYRTLHRSVGYSNHEHEDADMGRVDIVYVEGATARELLGSAAATEVFPGLTARVIVPEHLVAMKVLAVKNDPSRRLQDLADIVALLRATGLGADRVRSHFERHGLLDDWEMVRDSL